MGVLDDAIREHLELKRQRGAAEAELARQEAEALGPARRGRAHLGEEGDGSGREPDDAVRSASEVPLRSPSNGGPAERPAERPEEAAPGDRTRVSEPPPEPLEGGTSTTAPEPLLPFDHRAERDRAKPDDAEPPQAKTEQAEPPQAEPPPKGADAPPADPTVVSQSPPVEPSRDPEAPPAPSAAEPEPRRVSDAPEPGPIGDAPEPEPTRVSETPAPVPASSTPEPSLEEETLEEDDDVLEETPDFLQETPEHDRLWFEQKPPRDFDFDD